jgi:hypothetical protein
MSWGCLPEAESTGQKSDGVETKVHVPKDDVTYIMGACDEILRKLNEILISPKILGGKGLS